MRPIVILCLVLGAILGGLTALLYMHARGDFGSVPSQQVVGKATIGGPFTLTDHRGQRVTDKDFRGKKMLVYFGFTHCPDICPGSLQVISAALDKLGEKAKEITPVFITVDPERDTVAVMADYVANFHPSLVGLTGSRQDIEAAVKKTFRVYYKQVKEPERPDTYTIDHASLVYLMDELGDFEKVFPHPTSPKKLAQQLENFL